MADLTQEELEQFAEIMLEKIKLCVWETQTDRDRAIVQIVIADTYLLVSGAVPLETWLKAVETA